MALDIERRIELNRLVSRRIDNRFGRSRRRCSLSCSVDSDTGCCCRCSSGGVFDLLFRRHFSFGGLGGSGRRLFLTRRKGGNHSIRGTSGGSSGRRLVVGTTVVGARLFGGGLGGAGDALVHLIEGEIGLFKRRNANQIASRGNAGALQRGGEQRVETGVGAIQNRQFWRQPQCAGGAREKVELEILRKVRQHVPQRRVGGKLGFRPLCRERKSGKKKLNLAPNFVDVVVTIVGNVKSDSDTRSGRSRRTTLQRQFRL
jgi:hypothetical protein